VISANVAYPTDSGLLAKAVGKLVRTMRRVQAAGRGHRYQRVGRRRAAARRVREIASKLHSRGKLAREESTQVIAWGLGPGAGERPEWGSPAASINQPGATGESEKSWLDRTGP
jgi:transposase, IS5 family